MPGLFTEAFEGLKFDPKALKSFRTIIENDRVTIECMCVYAFWLIVSKWLPDVGITVEFAKKLGIQFNKKMTELSW